MVHDTRRALIFMTLSAICFGIMAFAAKLASAQLTGPQVACVRFASGLVPCLLIPRYRHLAFQFQRTDLLAIRGFFGGCAVLLYFIAIAHINVGVATLLNYTAPIYSGIFSVLFIGERISAKVLLPLPIALAGVYFVVHAHARPGDILGFGRWELFGVASAICSGCAVTAIRAARRSENSWSVYMSFNLLGFFVCIPFSFPWHMPHGSEVASLAATALFAIGAQLLMTFSLRWVDAMTVGVISQLAVIVSMFLGTMLLHETIPPMAAGGALLTIGGVLGVVYVTTLTKRVAAIGEVAPES
ncbi:MAG TPA: DMT family transporter [Thermoanaerobaculia bacterium]|jgi:drug/metabolite transporter (DMT)-like permease